ncbi:MAG: rubredoxin [Gammaproteobacteria bacterium]|nr:rubredoxin [Gammaproteobacteria bacterium]
MPYQKYICLLCGFIYDEEEGWPQDGLEPGTRWDEIADDWMCPECGAMKEDFQMIVIN